MSLYAKLSGFIELSRPHNVFVAVLNGLVGVVTVAAFSGLQQIPPHCLGNVYWALASIALVSAAGYAINDYFDADIDAVNKPWRPIPSGRVTPGEAHLYSLILFAIGVYSGFNASLLNGIYALLVSMLLYLYPAWMKRRKALLGHITVAATGASTILYGGLALARCLEQCAERLVYVLIPVFYAFALILAREFVKALEDYEGDLARNASTLATTYGVNVARYASIALLASIAASAELPVLAGYGVLYSVLAGIVALLNIYSVLLVARGEYAKARRMLKIAFGVGGLAFLLDPLLKIYS